MCFCLTNACTWRFKIIPFFVIWRLDSWYCNVPFAINRFEYEKSLLFLTVCIYWLLLCKYLLTIYSILCLAYNELYEVAFLEALIRNCALFASEPSLYISTLHNIVGYLIASLSPQCWPLLCEGLYYNTVRLAGLFRVADPWHTSEININSSW